MDTLSIYVCQSCKEGEHLLLLPKSIEKEYASWPVLTREGETYLKPIPIGTELVNPQTDIPEFCVTSFFSVPSTQPHFSHALLLEAKRDIPARATLTHYTLHKNGYTLAWITLSDKGSVGQRVDTSGPRIAEILQKSLPISLHQGYLLPDEGNELRYLLHKLALQDGFDIICTTGGTGLSPRDITPEITKRVLDRELPGFEQCMMAKSLSKTPHAILSRACAGLLHTSLILNLPGSAKAVEENLEAILPALPHALAKIHNDTTDCGGSL